MSDERAKKIKMMLFDVDGVMTDGTIFLFPAPGAGAGQETHEHREKMADKGGFGIASRDDDSKPRDSTRTTAQDFRWPAWVG